MSKHDDSSVFNKHFLIFDYQNPLFYGLPSKQQETQQFPVLTTNFCKAFYRGINEPFLYLFLVEYSTAIGKDTLYANRQSLDSNISIGGLYFSSDIAQKYNHSYGRKQICNRSIMQETKSVIRFGILVS